MLPGFRFLFAAIALSISTLVFGLGAAALLRASHERFASLPALQPVPALPPSATADASPHDVAPPTLALLRLDPPEPDDPAAGKVAAPDGDAAMAANERLQTAAPTPETPPSAAAAATEAITAQPEQPGDQPPAAPADIAQTVPAQAEPVQTELVQPEPTNLDPAPAGTVPAEPAQVEPVLAEPVLAEPVLAEPVLAQPTPADPVAAAAEPTGPAPLEPADAPIRTAMLMPTEPAASAIPDPAAVVTGPVPLPRSRQSALAREHKAQRAARTRRLAAARARKPVRPLPQSAAPASASPFE
ncbi:MAG: hypothetical protein M9932_09895 [Xanthobacteraceae bacterium]|nr:hypothetical protein [Xanthobacteraceae bacterium]